MKSIEGIGLSEVTSAYGSSQADFYALLLGQQLHVGGMNASIDLAERAGIGAGQRGIDLCCGIGGGMRVLVRFRNVGSMVGVDATPRNVERGPRICRDEGLADRIEFMLADACATGLRSGGADFVWGEDAWCIVNAAVRPPIPAPTMIPRICLGAILYPRHVCHYRHRGTNAILSEKEATVVALHDGRAGCRGHHAFLGRAAGAVDLLQADSGAGTDV